MRTKTKRMLAILLVMIMALSFALSGCTNKGEKPAPTPGPGTNPQPPVNNEIDEAKALYEKFLKGEAYATADDSFMSDVDSLVGNKDFSAQDLVNLFQYVYARPEANIYLLSADYAYIDCGLDGMPELALQLKYTMDENSGYEDFSEYIVIKAAEGKLNIAADVSAFYRSNASINKAGYIWSGGANSASAYYDEYEFVDASGVRTFLYSCTTEIGLEKAQIPVNYLSSEQSEGLPWMVEYTDEGYFLQAYNFNRFDYSSEGEGAYDEHLKETIFVFQDYVNTPVMPSEDDMKLYNERAINVYSVDEINSLLERCYEERGCTAEIVQAPAPEWLSLDTVKDMLSPSAQLRTFAENKSLWYLPEAEIPEGSYVYYALADLDHNNRLELIRCQKSYEPSDFCKNRFFEIGDDFNSVYKMDYDVETMWSNGEESGYSHDIVDQDSLLCFYNYDFGSALDDYSGTTFFYWAPDRLTYEGGESSLQMTFSLSNKGKVSTSTYCLSKTDANGKTSYMDEGGLDCNKKYYDDTMFRHFDSNDGWYWESVDLDFIMLRDSDSSATIVEQLHNSLTNYIKAL